MDMQLIGASGTIALADTVFSAAYNEALVHQVVVSVLAGARSGTKAQKTRAQVSGGGAKPWKQKGSGRARAGTIRSPIWRSGGVTFAARPRDFSKKVNRKMYRGALRSIFSELHRKGRLLALEAIDLETPKTKTFLAFAAQHNLGENVLIISESVNSNAYLGSRNLVGVNLIDVQALDPVLLLRHEKVAVDRAALEKINEWLS